MKPPLSHLLAAHLATIVCSAAVGLTGCEQKQHSRSPAPRGKPEPSIVAEVSAQPTDTTLPRVAKEIGAILTLPAQSVTPEKEIIKDLGADSLDAVEIIMAIEEEFSISIEDAAAENLRTVGDIVAYVRSRTKP